jgi:hypothetical protein
MPVTTNDRPAKMGLTGSMWMTVGAGFPADMAEGDISTHANASKAAHRRTKA